MPMMLRGFKNRRFLKLELSTLFNSMICKFNGTTGQWEVNLIASEMDLASQ